MLFIVIRFAKTGAGFCLQLMNVMTNSKPVRNTFLKLYISLE